MSWGGKRIGAGRKFGSKNKSESLRRKSRSLAAFDDEWLLISKFAKIVKYGDKATCEKFLASFDD